MQQHLAERLDIPLRECNRMLVAARLAPLEDPSPRSGARGRRAGPQRAMRPIPRAAKRTIAALMRSAAPHACAAGQSARLDVTLAELGLEAFFPADAATGEALRPLAGR
jgi:hypothetical protein